MQTAVSQWKYENTGPLPLTPEHGRRSVRRKRNQYMTREKKKAGTTNVMQEAGDGVEHGRTRGRGGGERGGDEGQMRGREVMEPRWIRAGFYTPSPFPRRLPPRAARSPPQQPPWLPPAVASPDFGRRLAVLHRKARKSPSSHGDSGLAGAGLRARTGHRGQMGLR